MKKFVFGAIIAVSLLLGSSSTALAQRGTLDKPTPGIKKQEPVANQESNVQGKTQIGQSHIKSLGTVGRTGRYEIVSVKVRGLDTPNVAGFFVYDSYSDQIVAVNTAGAPGLGVAIVNGASQVAGNYLFGSKLKPNQNNQTMTEGNDSVSNFSNSGASSNATGGTGNGGAGGNGIGGNGGNGGNGGAGGAGGNGGQKIPPGHINNPGHGGNAGGHGNGRN